MVSVDHMRHHVMDDAADLISLLGLVDPLINAPRLGDADDIAHSGRLLRRLLSRNLILVLCRLHERAQNGKTGVTASIDALLDCAQGQIADDRMEELKAKRLELIAELKADGVDFEHVRTFRTAEIAHSLHRESIASDTSLFYSSIAAFGRRTFDLLVEIEEELAMAGYTPFTDTPYLVEAWERRGAAIWAKAFAK